MTRESLPGLAKGATPDRAELLAELERTCRLRPTWLRDVKTVLGLKQPEMAELLGAPSLRTYQRWEKRPWTMHVQAYLRAKALLEAKGLDSYGKLRVAG